MRNVISTRKGLLAEDFAGKHIALIGTSSVEWIESYLGIITGCITAVPLDAALPCEELIDLINRSDSEALFLSPKHRPYLEAFLANCPKLQKVWMLQEEVEDVPSGVYSINELRDMGKSTSEDASCPDAIVPKAFLFIKQPPVVVFVCLNSTSFHEYCKEILKNADK